MLQTFGVQVQPPRSNSTFGGDVARISRSPACKACVDRQVRAPAAPTKTLHRQAGSHCVGSYFGAIISGILFVLSPYWVPLILGSSQVEAK